MRRDCERAHVWRSDAAWHLKDAATVTVVKDPALTQPQKTVSFLIKCVLHIVKTRVIVLKRTYVARLAQKCHSVFSFYNYGCNQLVKKKQ